MRNTGNEAWCRGGEEALRAALIRCVQRFFVLEIYDVLFYVLVMGMGEGEGGNDTSTRRKRKKARRKEESRTAVIIHVSPVATF